MSFSRIDRRRSAAAAAIAALALGMLGCAAEAHPEPTPTAAFASEEEAFAAAEQVYRDFTQYVNSVDISDPSTFEPMFALESGEYERSDRETFSEFHAEGFEMRGKTKILSFEGVKSPPPHDRIEAIACLDLSEVDIVDANGVSQVSPDRADIVGLSLTFTLNAGVLTINDGEEVEGDKCRV